MTIYNVSRVLKKARQDICNVVYVRRTTNLDLFVGVTTRGVHPMSDPLSAARGIANGAIVSIFLWMMLLSLILGGCATSASLEDRGDGVCFLDGACVPCEDLAEGCVFPMPKVTQ